MQVVVTSRQRRDQTQIGLVSGRKDDGGAPAVEFGDAPFQKGVIGIGSIRDTRAGRAGSRFV